MEELVQLREKLEHERPTAWEELPDIALYMDQLISYMPRQLIRFDSEELLTSAMVNNYIKDELVPRAEGKRYGKNHLACLTAVCAMKKVLSVKDMGVLMDAVRGGAETEKLYASFTQILDEALCQTAQMIDDQAPPEGLPRLALELAMRSYADQLACARVLNILRQRQPAKEKPREKTKKKHEEEGATDHE